MNHKTLILPLVSDIPETFTQARQVAEHLLSKDTHSISILEANELYRISSVTKVISVLKNKFGWPIQTERKRDETNKLYVRYHLAA